MPSLRLGAGAAQGSVNVPPGAELGQGLGDLHETRRFRTIQDKPPRRRVNQWTPRSAAAASVHAQGGAKGTMWRSALTTVGFGKGRSRLSDANRKVPPVA